MLPSQRDYTKFFTPIEIADQMVKMLDPQPGESILEPHAGDGAIVKRIKAYCPDALIFAIEINEKYKPDLDQFAQIVVMVDFMQLPEYAKWTKCIANPPFGNGIDLDAHFQKIRRCVKSGGKVVMIVPKDFDPDIMYVDFPIENWATNSDGTKTEIKIIVFIN